MERQSSLVFKWSLVAVGALWTATRSGVESRAAAAAVGNETYFMDGDRCNSELSVSGAAVISHAPALHLSPTLYRHNVECKIVFHARHEGWRLMLLFEYLDIPDRTMGDLCTDAVYIYDSAIVGSRAVKTAGGNSGLCGHNVPALITSTGRQLTVYFRTDSSGVRGRGFKFIVTAFHKGYASEDGGCGLHFKCKNERCIDSELVCDGVAHCGDISDETHCGLSTAPTVNGSTYVETLWDKFISLGTTVCVLIAAALATALVLLTVCTVCLCRRHNRRKKQNAEGGRRAAARGARCEHGGRDDGPCAAAQGALLARSRPPVLPYDPGLPRQQVLGDPTCQSSLFESPDSAFVHHGNYHPAAPAAVMYHSFSTAAQAGSSASYASHWQDAHESCSHSSGYSSQQTPASVVSAALQAPSAAAVAFYHQQPMHKLPTVQQWHYGSAASTSNCSRGTSCHS